MTMSSPTSTLPETRGTTRLKIDQVTFSYGDETGVPVLENVSADFSRNRISLVTGPSGCGKSTLLYLAAGIYPNHAGTMQGGSVTIEGAQPASLAPGDRAALVGMVFQNPSLQFCMDTVENELLFCLGNARVPPDEMPAAIDRALESCGIRHLRARTLRSLSGGEKQMVALACVVALNPAWLLLDEPFANVDDASARALVRQVVKIHQAGTGVLVVDHRVDHWLGIADEVWRFDDHRMLRRVDPDDLPLAGSRERGWRDLARRLKVDSGLRKEAPARLTLRDVRVRREGRALLDGTSFTFRAGEVYAITGRSGSGKSTFFDVLLGAVPYTGEIALEGEPLHRRGRILPGSIGFVAQNPQDQFVADTVHEEVATSLTVAGADGDAGEKMVERVLRPIGLWGHRNFSPYMLSQGQQRRLGVAALMIYGCKVLVCDEPTYAQDDARAQAIMERLLGLVRERGMTLIFSTHDEVMARHVADVVLRLEGGRFHAIDQSVV